MSAPSRICTIEGCGRPHHALGLCTTHRTRLSKHGDVNYQPAVVNREERLEDCHWMAETGECLTGAARRLGISRDALERWLIRNDRECLTTLLAHEPKDHNRVIDGFSVSELIGQTARRKRRREMAA